MIDSDLIERAARLAGFRDMGPCLWHEAEAVVVQKNSDEAIAHLTRGLIALLDDEAVVCALCDAVEAVGDSQLRVATEDE